MPKYPLKDADGHTLKKGQRVQIKVTSAGSPRKHCCFFYTAECSRDARLKLLVLQMCHIAEAHDPEDDLDDGQW